MNFITRITVPIENYLGDDVFFKQLYFQCENKSPSKEQVINAIEKIHNENTQYLEYTEEEFEVLEIIKLVSNEKWRYVSPCSIVSTNTFVDHPKFSKQPFSWDVINLIKIEKMEEK